MYLTPEVKQQIFADYGTGSTDTGSAESQVALFTHRIKHLTEHLKQNKKDITTKRSLINLVGKRKSMLDYLKRQDIERYRAIIKKLGLRK
jgi:small subunit ribosomal protein S15